MLTFIISSIHFIKTLGFTSYDLDTSVVFEGLPSDPIYTLGMDTHSSWLIRPYESEHDLDNIHLSSLSGSESKLGVRAIYNLDHIMVEGHAREGKANVPPRGVQLQLTTSDSTPVADTLIMANLGYFQFKAVPGVFDLSIREGRGRDIFEVESAGNEGYNSPTVAEAGSIITLTDFEGVIIFPRLVRRPGKESDDVLAPEETAAKDGIVAGIFSKYVTFLTAMAVFLLIFPIDLVLYYTPRKKSP